MFRLAWDRDMNQTCCLLLCQSRSLYLSRSRAVSLSHNPNRWRRCKKYEIITVTFGGHLFLYLFSWGSEVMANLVSPESATATRQNVTKCFQFRMLIGRWRWGNATTVGYWPREIVRWILIRISNYFNGKKITEIFKDWSCFCSKRI